MNSVAPASQTRPFRVPLLILLASLFVTLLFFVIPRAHYLTDFSLTSYSTYFWPHRRFGLLFHLTGGLIAITTGLVQIWLGLTHRTGTLHRTVGKFYACGVAVGSIGGFYLGFTSPSPFAYKAGLISLNVAWLITTGMALYAISTKRIEQHREWMLRSYVVTFSFVIFRLSTVLLGILLFGRDPAPGTPEYSELTTTMAWAAWAIPLVLAEPLIQLRAMRRLALG
jgi:uncharacterized membrane protein YozB (DUF420 family)